MDATRLQLNPSNGPLYAGIPTIVTYNGSIFANLVPLKYKYPLVFASIRVHSRLIIQNEVALRNDV